MLTTRENLRLIREGALYESVQGIGMISNVDFNSLVNHFGSKQTPLNEAGGAMSSISTWFKNAVSYILQKLAEFVRWIKRTLGMRFNDATKKIMENKKKILEYKGDGTIRIPSKLLDPSSKPISEISRVFKDASDKMVSVGELISQMKKLGFDISGKMGSEEEAVSNSMATISTETTVLYQIFDLKKTNHLMDILSHPEELESRLSEGVSTEHIISEVYGENTEVKLSSINGENLIKQISEYDKFLAIMDGASKSMQSVLERYKNSFEHFDAGTGENKEKRNAAMSLVASAKGMLSALSKVTAVYTKGQANLIRVGMAMAGHSEAVLEDKGK